MLYLWDPLSLNHKRLTKSSLRLIQKVPAAFMYLIIDFFKLEICEVEFDEVN